MPDKAITKQAGEEMKIVLMVCNVLVDLAIIAVVGLCAWHFNDYRILWFLLLILFSGWSLSSIKDKK